MGRDARLNYSGLVYHVVNRGNDRQVIFAEPEDYRHYLNTIQRYKKKYRFQLFAYCLMTNHVHLLIKTSESGSISRIMQSITVAHTRRYNFKYRRCGHVWQGRFHSPIVSEDNHMLTVMRYIEQNPLRARMVRDVVDYHWSSYGLNVRIRESVLIDRKDNKVFENLGGNLMERIYNYRQKMAQEIAAKELDKIQYGTRKAGNYISEKFKDQIAFLLPRRKGRGRPRSRELCHK